MRSTRLGMAASIAAGCVMAVLAAQPSRAQTYKVLYSFAGGADGAYPYAGVIRDAKGSLYGTTPSGGAAGGGAVFKLRKAGREVVLHSFTGVDGGPAGGVIQDDEGNLYGTAINGGVAGAGTVFKLSKTGKETVLYTFRGGTDGSIPSGGVIRDAKGNLYGTTLAGGRADVGTVFKVSMTGKESILHRFKGGADGANPNGVILDAKGNLYGTTQAGGSGQCRAGNVTGCGTVFKVDTTGKETVLYNFTAGADGDLPAGPLIQDAAGNLYGTTYNGGGGPCYFLDAGCGTVFKLNKRGKETVLYRFTGGNDGAGPSAGLIQDAKRNFYSTTKYGGSSSCQGDGCGVVFKLGKTGKLTVLYSFSGGADGFYPWAGLFRDAKGSLYGTATYGGDILSILCGGNGFGCGVVFKLKP